jgi:guanylate kinase
MDQQFIDKINAYQMPQAAIDLLSANPPIIIAGTSGAGKDTIAPVIIANGEGIKVVTHTTRQIRPGEENGKDYWFVSDQQMLELVNSQAMIEVKIFPKGSQTTYGISIEAYEKAVASGRKPMLIIDVRGIEEIMGYVASLKATFILPPSFEEWMERLDQRGHMSHVERLRRLHSAGDELETVVNNPHFILVVNREVNQAVHDVLDSRANELIQGQNRELARELIAHVKAY